MLLASPQGMMIMYEPEDCLVAPLAIGNWEERIEELYGESMSDWFDEHLRDIYEATKTCMIGEIAQRQRLQQRLDEYDVNSVFDIEDEDLRDSIIEKYQDDIRTSLYDLHPRINGLLKRLKKKLIETE